MPPLGPHRDWTPEDRGTYLAKTLLKVEMAKRNFTYKDLVEALSQEGVNEDERNLRNKISRGAFSASFFFICMHAMRVRALDMSLYFTADD
jgi:hypothetical protein